MASVRIDDGNLKSSVTGIEKIPCGGSGNPVINADLIATYFGKWADWTPTFTGFSADPTYVARYCKIGKLVFVWLTMSALGTSNATTKTITLPFATPNTGTSQRGSVVSIVDNGGTVETQIGMISARNNSNIADIHRDQAQLAWTASGTCKFDFTFFYESAS